MTVPLSMTETADVRDVWPHIVDRLEEVSEGEAWRPEDVYLQLLTANAYLWATPDLDGFVVVQLLNSPSTRDLHIWIAHHRGDGSVVDFMEQLREIARAQNIDRITFESWRPGWARVFPNATIRQLYIIDV